MIRTVIVVIPAANEEALISRCLTALATAATQAVRHTDGAIRIHTTVVLDRCSDATALAIGCHPHVETVPSAAGRAGAARALGVETALRRHQTPLAETWIANTDADSQVPPHWITHFITEANRGAHLVLGTVLPADDLALTVRRRWRDRHYLHEGHSHIHGANFGIRADTYVELGGWRPLATGEDVDLAQRAATAGRFNTVRTASAPVTTSGRLIGRAPHGFAHYLQTQTNQPIT